MPKSQETLAPDEISSSNESVSSNTLQAQSTAPHPVTTRLSGIEESDGDDTHSLSSSSIEYVGDDVQAYHADSQRKFPSGDNNQQQEQNRRLSNTNSINTSIDSEASANQTNPHFWSAGATVSATGGNKSTTATTPLSRHNTANPIRRRTSTISSWFQRSNSFDSPKGKGDGQVDDSLNRIRSRKMSRQLSNFSATRVPFNVDGTLPSAMISNNDEVMSILLKSEHSDHSDFDDDGLSSLDSDGYESHHLEDQHEKDSDSTPQQYDGEEPIQKTTTLNRIQTLKDQMTAEVKDKLDKIGLFDPRLEKFKICLKFFRGYLLLTGIFMGAFSLYWGSMYQREKRLVNMNVHVVLDDPNTYESLGIDDYFSDAMVASTSDPVIAAYAGWHTMPYTDLTDDPSEIRDILLKKVHHQECWGAIWIKPNSSIDYLSALKEDGSFNVSDAIEVIYETGRQYIAVSSYLSKSFTHLQTKFLSFQQEKITIPLTNELSNDQIVSNLKTLLTPIQFKIHDITDQSLIKAIVSGPQQFGLVYLHLLSLMQFAFFQPFHIKMAARLTDRSFIIYRLVSSQITYLVMGLAYTLVQIAFSINIYAAYNGKTGFLIFWLITYLMLSALGGVNENVVMMIQLKKPNLAPTWMLFWMILNIAPTYYPAILSPHFYRYGYALPIKNGFDLFMICLFDTYKQATLTRNILVLISWVVLMNTCLPFTMIYYSKKTTQVTNKKIQDLKKLRKRQRRQKLKEKLGLTHLIPTNTSKQADSSELEEESKHTPEVTVSDSESKSPSDHKQLK